MIKKKREEIIVCFISLNDPRYITQFFINSSSFEVINTNSSFLQYTSETIAVKSLKSSVNSDKNQSLVCFYIYTKSGYCTIYTIENNTFSSMIDYNMKCRGQYENINLYYMRETKQYIFICVETDNNATIIIFDENLENQSSHSAIAQGSQNGFSFIYSYDLKNYFIISEGEGGNSKIVIPSIGNIDFIEDKIENISLYINTQNTNSDNIITNIPISSTIFTSILFPSQTNNYPSTTSPEIISTISKISTTIISEDSTLPNIESTISKVFTSFPIESENFSTIINIYELTTILTYKQKRSTSIPIDSTFLKLDSTVLSEKINEEKIKTDKIEIKKEKIMEEIPSIMKNVEIGQVYQKNRRRLYYFNLSNKFNLFNFYNSC